MLDLSHSMKLHDLVSITKLCVKEGVVLEQSFASSRLNESTLPQDWPVQDSPLYAATNTQMCHV
jgi:hypothetical protein